jgi:hypothetical protein
MGSRLRPTSGTKRTRVTWRFNVCKWHKRTWRGTSVPTRQTYLLTSSAQSNSEGSSLAGAFTRVEMGHMVMGSDG